MNWFFILQQHLNRRREMNLNWQKTNNVVFDGKHYEQICKLNKDLEMEISENYNGTCELKFRYKNFIISNCTEYSNTGSAKRAARKFLSTSPLFDSILDEYDLND
jgi:hypothetical protein